jgi:large subunit ribosomal protein L5
MPEETVEETVEGELRNPMLELRVGKVVVNICVGTSGESLEKAVKILEELTGQKPSIRRAKKTIRAFGIRRKEPIACMVTLRGEKAERFLKKTLEAVGNRIPLRSFDEYGNFAFGIREHIDISGVEYKPEMGIVGMDVIVNIERPGYRVARRRRARSRIGRRHMVTREEAVEFIRSRFGAEVF